MTKYQLITQMYESKLHQVTKSPDEWTTFMRSACRNYKCRFDEQVLIYAQRPDATAVLEIEKWNRQFGRWVNAGATGIAVFDDEHNGNYRLKHYFDIADTHESRNSRPVPRWTMASHYDPEVVEHLDNSFGELEDTSSLAAALISTANNTVDDNLSDYLDELLQIRDGSFLEELDDTDVEAIYQTTLRNNVAYMLLTRCGIEADDYLTKGDFANVTDFNTPQTVNALGIATSDIAETCLREISTVLNLQKQERNLNHTVAMPEKSGDNVDKSNERGIEHGTDIQNGERLQNTQSDSTGGTTGRLGQIRADAEEISQTEPQNIVRESVDVGQVERTSDGYRADGKREDGTADRADGSGAGRDRGHESQQSDEVDRLDEQHTALSGGDNTERLDILIKPLPTQIQQLNLLGEAEDLKPSAFSVSQQIIDEILTSGGNEPNSPHRIVSYFKKGHNIIENVDFLQDEYRRGGKGFIIGDNRVSVWFNETGIHAAVGDTALNTEDAVVITWEQAAKRIRELLELARYMSQSELNKVDGYELKALADSLWDIYRDRADGLELPFMDEDWFKGGHPESTARIAEVITDPETRQNILYGLQEFAASCVQDSSLLRFNNSYNHLKYALNTLEDLRRDPMEYTADETVSTARPGFITQDEIDRLICRGGIVDQGKFRIYSYFLQSNTAKEKIRFLKDEYGIGGNGRIGFNEWHDSKGISYSRDINLKPYDKILLSWNKVARRIDELIADGKYMTQRELEQIPEYEKTELAREVVGFYPYQPEDLPRPFPHGMDYSSSVRIVRPQLDEPERVAEILSQMQSILDNTADFDRNYEYMRKAFEDLTAYKNGTFSLFTSAKPAEKETEHTFPAPPQPEPPAPPTDETIVYELQLGVTVFIGTEEYEVYSFDDTRVVLRDLNAPLFTKDLPRDEFDRKLRENRLNDGLIKAPASESESILVHYVYIRNDAHEIVDSGYIARDNNTGYEILDETKEGALRRLREHIANENHTEPQQGSEIDEDAGLKDQIRDRLDWLGYVVSDELVDAGIEEFDNRGLIGNHDDIADFIEREYLSEQVLESLVGNRYEIDGRLFTVESVDEYNERVELRDITFENAVSMPIFRSESLDFIRRYEPIHEETADPEQQPGYEEWSEPATLENAPENPGEPSDDVETYLPTEKETVIPTWELDKYRSRAQSFDPFPDIPLSDRINYRIADDELGYGGAKTKFKNNVEAIKTLLNIESEDRLATPEEQEILARYVGWGGLPQAFDPDNKQWEDEYLELNMLLSTEDWKSARESTVNAHYTSPVVIKAIYNAVENMGFKTGNILEPSCGIGNFLGLVPDSMSGSRMFGVELDSVTGRIARQLYQKNSIAIQGFEDTDLPDSFFDLAIGNVPFGSYSIADKRYDKHKFNIHDYFFAKTLDKVRPGGIVAFVTSKGTLDKENPAVRKYIAQRAELLGAIRLPNTAFKANAGTEVTSDIIFLQKRDRIVDIEPDWVHLGETEDGIPVNSYFAEHPDMILGTMSRDDGVRMYGNANDTTCLPFPESDLSEQLSEAIANIHAQITEYELDDYELDEDNSIPADPSVRNFSYTFVDGQIYYRQDSRMIPQELPITTQNRVKGLIELRECTRNLIFYQTNDYPENAIKAEQDKLNRLYDDFTKKYGLINSRGNSIAFAQDNAYYLLCSLEVLDENGELERKADMFSKRTIQSHTPVTHVDTASEALAVSLAEKAKVDIEFMSQLANRDSQTIVSDLSGIIFMLPQEGESVWVTAEEYLSGNIREKLATATDYASRDSKFDVNVKALESALPKDLTAAEISVRLGATWLPPDVVQQFMYELLQTPKYAQWHVKVQYISCTGEWNISQKSYDKANIHSYNTYGTQRINAYKIIEDSLNLRDVRVWDKVYEDNQEKRVLNKKETAIAQAKQEIIRSKFADWIWKDPERREQLCRLYNDKFNSIRPREYDGSHLTFSGMNPEIQLREHQINAIARGIYGGNTLLAHEVGAGKTFEMVAIAMENKRLGLSNKSMFVVPNHLTEQWAAEFLRLYPAANILVATKKDFETRNRKKFCARISTGDYDAVIIGHSQFEKIPMSIARQRATIERQIDDIVDGIRDIKANNGERYTIKQMEKMRKSLEVRLKKLNDQSRKDDIVTFEELGVDRLFIDESHYFKNLFLITKMRNVGGVPQTEAQKSSDLFMKCRYLDELTGGRGIVFATGTPISNSMVELYTIQRYLQFGDLDRNGLQHFDAWASTFGETVTAIELAPEGTGYRAKTRFAKFYNLPELMSMFKMVADIQTADMLNLPVPKANFHTRVISPSEWQKEMVAELAERAQAIRDRKVEPHVDNMLKVTNDGRKLALDQRLINDILPDYTDSKVAACADDVFRIWDETKDRRLTQLLFCDLSTPKNDEQFNVYDDLKKKLITKGVPAEEIAFIHEAKTETQKTEMFAKVRKGQIRVLMGSTQKMGAGTNVQDKLIALHDLDCPWRPSDLAQRLGRIARQGNNNPEVEIFRYVTEGTFDSYLYQLVENKQKFIAQVMTSKTPVRVAEDVDETALSYAEIKALATGNPLIIEKCQLDMDVNKLKILQASHNSQKYALEDRILKWFPQEIQRLTELIAGYKIDIETVKRHPAYKNNFPPMKIGGIIYAEKAEAGKAIIEACKAMTSPDPVPLGEYRGFQMVLSFDKFAKDYRITLSNALSRTVALGTDIHGNITRLDNMLEGFAESLSNSEELLAETHSQFEAAQIEVQRPFEQEQEYTEKSMRLKEINSLLNMDEKENAILDDGMDEVDVAEPERVAAVVEQGR